MSGPQEPDPKRPKSLSTAITAYDNVSAAYESGRPAYPPEAVAWVIEEAGIGAGRRVLDLAAGTGKLTRLLLPSGATVIAVEPVSAFRDQLRKLGVETYDGSAEAIPLPDASIDLVTVGTAFHWFDAPRALAEIRRVVKPRGSLAILWNQRDPRDRTQRALTELIEPHRRGEPRQSDEHWRHAFREPCGFGPLRKLDFRHDHHFTPRTLVDRVASISFIAALPDRARQAVLADVAELARTRRDNAFDLPHIAHVYITARADD